MFASGLFDPTMIPSYVGGLGSLVVIAASVRRLSQADRETNRPHNRMLHQLKWTGLATCFSVILVKSSVRIWYIRTARGPSFIDESWWQYLWVIFVVAAVGTTGLAAFLRWADRPFPPGHCRECGYALKGNVSGVCPECGTAIASRLVHVND